MLQENDIIISLFLSITKIIGSQDHKHSQGKLYLSEIILCGVLFALKGVSFRRFYVWLKRKRLFPELPDRTRLTRLLITHKNECNKFLSTPTFFSVMDSFGVEIIHPMREGRSKQSQIVSKKGMSNHRWIVGRKINTLINGNLEIVKYQDETDNVSDNSFNEEYKDILSIILADMGFRKKTGIPDNFKICEKGKWNDRMIIETIFSLWTRICNLKHSFHRTINGFKAKVAYVVALTNIIFRSNESLGFNRLSMVQWSI